MRHNKNRGVSPPLVSGSSLLVIFALLCLTTFALLSLSTVQAHLRQCDNMDRAIQGYYEADCEAEELLAQLRADARSQPDQGSRTYALTVPISDSQALAVEIAVAGPNDYRVLRWQTVSTADWVPNDDLVVWDGTTDALDAELQH